MENVTLCFLLMVIFQHTLCGFPLKTKIQTGLFIPSVLKHFLLLLSTTKHPSDYLSLGRSSSVSLATCFSSDTKSHTVGTPQGSVFGILFYNSIWLMRLDRCLRKIICQPFPRLHCLVRPLSAHLLPLLSVSKEASVGVSCGAFTHA